MYGSLSKDFPYVIIAQYKFRKITVHFTEIKKEGDSL